MKKTVAVDMFCGAGGTSTGLARALGDPERIELTAINHWTVALETHERNHPWARHIPERIEALKPREVVPGGRVSLLVASPYQFAGTKTEVVKQIGNAVPVGTAEALCRAILEEAA